MTAHEPTSVKTYLIVFGGLALLTGLTVILSYAGLPHKTAIVAAALISLTKCFLIASFFMHLRSEYKTIYIVLLTAVALVAVLALAILPDIGLVR